MALDFLCLTRTLNKIISYFNVRRGERAEGDRQMADAKKGSYVIVGSRKVRNADGVFRDVSLPNGKHVFVLNRRVFDDAVGKANESMKEASKRREKIAS